MVHVLRRLLAVLGVGALGVGAAAPAAGTDILRICADPDNLPFSAAAGPARGLYVDVAEIVAARLGARTEYAWWHTDYGQRAVRNTLLADRCDVFFGLPDDEGFMGRQLDRTTPFLDVGDAVVVPPAFAFANLEDLKRVTVAVQFRSQPQFMLATRDGFRMATFRHVEEAMDALARGEAGAAFVWGPTAGYYNKTRLAGAWRVVPVAGPGLQWQVTAAVRKGNVTLKERIERTLVDLGPEIRRLADGYGFPLTTPVSLEPNTEAPPAAAPASSPAPASTTPPVNPFDGRLDVVPAGRSVFNQHCAHCHGPNAQSPEPSRDLRRLKRRYGDQQIAVYYTTVTAGRPTKGMPPWGQALSEDEVWQMWTFLESIQAEP
jgi:mono/diheme cytochrome c family protein/ABC-type amino acid transport substrate-binding protein